MNFKKFTNVLNEAKFREISPNLMAQVKRIAKLYDEKYRLEEDKETLKALTDEGVISKLSDNPAWKLAYFDKLEGFDIPKYFAPDIASVNIEDLETKTSKPVKFIIIYGDVTDDYASYVEEFERVNLFNENLYQLPTQRIESIILHELTHSFQEYKAVSKGYEENVAKASKDFDAQKYYFEPIEFDSHLNEIAFTIRKKYKSLKDSVRKAKDPVAKKILKNRLDLFLQEINVFIKAPLETYLTLKELTLPSYLNDFEYFLETIKTKPKYWQKFKYKMDNIYKELLSN